MQANAITFTGGLVSAERCTLRTTRTLMVSDGIALLRWSAAGSLQGNGITVRNGHLHASDSTFSRWYRSSRNRRASTRARRSAFVAANTRTSAL